MLKTTVLAILAMMIFTGEKTIYDFTFKDIHGKEVKFSDFKGKKIMIVNTASECGYTYQYEGLQQLHEKYKDKLVLVGFPANNFGGQEPGTNDEIEKFCADKYSVTFIMASKVSVKGDDIAPLFQWLIEQPNPDFTGNIHWNFEKFLFDENGKLIHRWRSGTKPMSDDILSAVK